MGKGFKHGPGGVNLLNFKIVDGTEAPTRPQMNMIWVNTDVKISDWYFGNTAPDAPADAMVWFQTGDASIVSFNCLKKHGITLYPLNAYQYLSGLWVRKAASIWMNGWKEWFDGVLYNAGDLCEYITGGWEDAWERDSDSDVRGHVDINDDGAIHIYSDSGDAYQFAKTVKKINITGFSRLVIDVGWCSGSGSQRFGLSRGEEWTGSDCMLVHASIDDNTGERTLDISEVEDGDYYVCLYTSGTYSNMKVSGVRLKV